MGLLTLAVVVTACGGEVEANAVEARDPGSDALAEGTARVINVGSIDGIQAPSLETYAYSASKAAVHHLTRVLAKQLAPRSITVSGRDGDGPLAVDVHEYDLPRGAAACGAATSSRPGVRGEVTVCGGRGADI